MQRLVHATFGLALALLAAPVNAQSFNIEFGNPGSAPASSYAAAGLPGTWNSFAVLSSSPQQIVTIFGGHTGATIKNIGGTAVLSSDDPGTTGDDEKLLDDMLISMNNPTDACLFVSGVENGDYDVIIYAMTPGSDLESRVRVDFADQGPQFVGGAWPGQHEELITYARFTVTVTNNEIDFHSGLAGALIQSGVNGAQIRKLVTGDLNGDGFVDSTDRAAFCDVIGSAAGDANYDMYADLNSDDVINQLDQAMW